MVNSTVPSGSFPRHRAATVTESTWPFATRSLVVVRIGDRVSRVVAEVSGLIRPRRLVASGTSIDGSLLYGDLPAPDGAETTDIAEALSELEWRPQHPKSHIRGSVLSALMSILVTVLAFAEGTWPSAAVDRIASTPARYEPRCHGRAESASGADRRETKPDLTGFAGMAPRGGHRRPASTDPGPASTPVGRMTSILAGPTGPHPHTHERRPAWA